MSGEDSLLARWARRRQAVRRAEAGEPEEEHKGRPPLTEVGDAPADPLPAAGSAPAEPLPSLEDLTADSDLAAFLRKDVPELLRRAALRKMWSLDPAIRDHVGLAEYAWDFNQPDSMPGFGPIASTGAVPEFLSRPVTAEAADPKAPAPASSVRRPEAPRVKAEAADGPTTSPPAQGETACGPEPPAPTEPDERPRSRRAAATGGHGGALPRH
jgi:hypothetical protein